MIRKGPAFLALLFVLTVSLSAFGQGRRNQQQQQQDVPQTQQGVGPVPQSKDEADAFTALQREQAPDKKVELAEAFVTKYPNSDFVDRKSTRLNSSHLGISYAVFCLKK